MARYRRAIIRVAVDVTSHDPLRDVFTGTNPTFWNGTDVEFQLAFFRGSGAEAQLLGMLQFLSVTVTVKALASKLGVAYMEKTADRSAINLGLTIEDWNNGDDQHLVITFTASESTLPLNSADFVDFWLAIHGSTQASPIATETFGCGVLRALEDGVSDTAGPVQGGNIVPANAVYDGSGHYVLNVTLDRVYKWTDGGVNDTDVVNGTQTVSTSDTAFTAQGATVTLRGTPSAAVTAVVRTGVFLTADESDARYLLKAGDVRMTCLENGLTYRLDVILVDGVATETLTEISGGGSAQSVLGPGGITYNLSIVLVDGAPTLTLTAV